jgi:hypothetical protein
MIPAHSEHQDCLPQLIHPLLDGKPDDLEDTPELIVCDGGPDCPYSAHY